MRLTAPRFDLLWTVSGAGRDSRPWQTTRLVVVDGLSWMQALRETGAYPADINRVMRRLKQLESVVPQAKED